MTVLEIFRNMLQEEEEEEEGCSSNVGVIIGAVVGTIFGMCLMVIWTAMIRVEVKRRSEVKGRDATRLKASLKDKNRSGTVVAISQEGMEKKKVEETAQEGIPEPVDLEGGKAPTTINEIALKVPQSPGIMQVEADFKVVPLESEEVIVKDSMLDPQLMQMPSI